MCEGHGRDQGQVDDQTLGHCGPALKGEFARSLNLTCVHTGWVFSRSVRNNAHVHILGAPEADAAGSTTSR